MNKKRKDEDLGIPEITPFIAGVGQAPCADAYIFVLPGIVANQLKNAIPD